MMILIDSNIIIYAASGYYPALTDWLAEQNAVVSAVTMLEVMGYHKLQTEEKTELENLFSQLTVMYPTLTYSDVPFHCDRNVKYLLVMH